MQPPRSRHLAELVAEMARFRPQHPAVISGARTLTYADLDGEIRTASGALAALGVGRDATVGLLCTNRWEWIAVALGAMRLGARVAAFNSWAKAWDLDYMLRHSRAEVLVCVDRFETRDYRSLLGELLPELSASAGGWSASRYPALREVAMIGDPGPLAAAHTLDAIGGGDLEPEPRHAAHDDAVIIYTSGSSARPKAVLLVQGAIIENGFAIGERMGLTPEDRVWVPVPLFWSYGGVNATPATLTHGATVVLQEGFAAAAGLDIIERHRCTAAYLLPNITRALLGEPRFTADRTRSLRTGLTIGSAEDVRLAADGLGIRGICNVYGSTETYGNCCVTPADLPLQTRLESQGPALPGMTVQIVDPVSEAPLPAGEIGEIQVGGRISRGYLRDDGSIAPILSDAGWFRTGDLGSVGDDGMLRFAGRATEMIKTGGINVAPAEVEEFLALHPAVEAAAVVGAPDPEAGEVVVAFVVLAKGASLEAEDLRAWCRERIGGFKVPRRITIVDALPLTDTGKLSRRALKERVLQAESQAAP